MLLDTFGAEKPFFTFAILSAATICGVPFLVAAYRKLKMDEAKVNLSSKKTMQH